MDRNAQRMVGKVISNAMDKTVVVSVERLVKHKLYKKYIKRSKKYYAHDEKNAFNVGDTVQIVASKPLSKQKDGELLSLLMVAKNNDSTRN